MQVLQENEHDKLFFLSFGTFCYKFKKKTLFRTITLTELITFYVNDVFLLGHSTWISIRILLLCVNVLHSSINFKIEDNIFTLLDAKLIKNTYQALLAVYWKPTHSES